MPQSQTEPYQQDAYFNAAETNDPFFQPEGEARRTQRLNWQLDTLISRIDLPGKSGGGGLTGSEMLGSLGLAARKKEDVETESETKNPQAKTGGKEKSLVEGERDLDMKRRQKQRRGKSNDTAT